MAKWNSQTTIGGTVVAVDDLLLLSDQSQAAGSRDRNISVSDLSYATGRFSVGQTAHGLSVKDCVWFDGTDYVQATADTASNARVIGVIVQVIDADNIVIQSTGYAFGLSGLSAGSTYYLQDAGGLGTSPGTVVVPVLLASSTSTGWLLFATQNQPDYEHGTWTPTYEGSTSNPTFTVSVARAEYVKLSRVVTVRCWFAINASAAGTGDLEIHGFPFPIDASFTSDFISVPIADSVNWPANDFPSGIRFQHNNAYGTLLVRSGSDARTGWNPKSAASLSTGSAFRNDIRFMFSYMTDS